MVPADYLNEADLQELLEKHAALLGSCTTENDGEERELLLIKREMGVPDQEDGNDRWAVDHLYVDQNCIPVLVEVKNSRNGDLRRAVVGQLLDYAANGAEYWSVATLRTKFEEQWQDRAAEVLETFLESAGLEASEFWRRIERNLEEHNIRIVFAAPELPRELCRVIEFLNEQMKDVEVLGIELRQFRTEHGHTPGLRAIAPSVVGRTTQAQITKERGAGPKPSYEILDQAVVEYRRMTKNTPPVDSRRGHYRQIHPWPNLDDGFHYEMLLQARTGLTCEFHMEVPQGPEYEQTLRGIADGIQRIGSAPLEFVRRGGRPALRVTLPDGSDGAAVAKTMVDLIRTTRAQIETVILNAG
jgi:hypothetical protein